MPKKEIRLSTLLIQELCDADHNCPFRRATPVFMCEAWYAASQMTKAQLKKAVTDTE